jgi:hypothetical protein
MARNALANYRNWRGIRQKRGIFEIWASQRPEIFKNLWRKFPEFPFGKEFQFQFGDPEIGIWKSEFPTNITVTGRPQIVNRSTYSILKPRYFQCRKELCDALSQFIWITAQEIIVPVSQSLHHIGYWSIARPNSAKASQHPKEPVLENIMVVSSTTSWTR